MREIGREREREREEIAKHNDIKETKSRERD